MAEEDILFGKHRHLFGGIEPSNMVKFDVRMDSYIGKVVIDAELPSDTIVDGQTLCTVAGAIIRKRIDDFPIDEFDGEEVANITESTSIIDANVDKNKTYYYAAFPYSKQGVYNRNKVNRVIANEPLPILEFKALRNNDGSITLQVKMLDTYKGFYICRSDINYPVNENDGDRIVTVSDKNNNINYEGEFIDNEVTEGVTYYYTIFPYTADGVVSRHNENNRAYCTSRTCDYYFGYDIDLNNPDPDARVIYPIDVDNHEYDKAFMNYTNSPYDFNYGDWPSKAGDKFMPKPCMLKNNGVVDHYLDPGDYTKREDGTSASSIKDTSFDGNAMMEWPKIYTKREEINGIYKFRCSDVKHDNTWGCWCNYDKNDNEIDHFYTSIYPCIGYGGKLRSISGKRFTAYNQWNGGAKDTTSASMMTFAQTIGYAQLNGDDWYIDVLADRLLIQDLLVMMAKTTDCQTAYGYGEVGSDNTTNGITGSSGSGDSYGLFYQIASNGYNCVKVFGMEHWWGNYNRWVAGLIAKRYDLKFKITRGMKDGTTVSDYNTDGSGYHAYIKAIDGYTSDSNISGYIRKCETTPFGRIPVTDNGSSTTYECDNIYIYNSSTPKVALAGGKYDDNTSAGPFAINFDNTANSVESYTITGLSCKPSK